MPRRPTPHRRLLAVVAAVLVAALAAAPDASAASPEYPTLSRGARGADVRALQELLRHAGRDVPVSGVFDGTTQTAVAAFQEARGRTVTGTANPGTWEALTPGVRPGSTGPGVRAAQRLLNEKRRAGLTVDGVFDAATRTAVIRFQRHAGIKQTGTMTEATWRRLVAHYEKPVWKDLCDYEVGNGAANWGTGSAIGQLEAAAARMVEAGYGRVAVGDVSFEHGGDIPLHQTHEVGMDVDIRPMRDARDQCRWGVNYRWSTYNRKRTRALVKAIRATASRHVKLIYFNDPVLIGEGLTTAYPGHDDHLHVRYCEPAHPRPAYRCAAAPFDPASLDGAGTDAPEDAATDVPAGVPGATAADAFARVLDAVPLAGAVLAATRR